MKKRFITLALSALMVTALVGCGNSGDNATSGDAATSGENKSLMVGMVTDSGTIDDKSFNEGTWTGIQKAEKDLGIKTKYLQPDGETHANYITKITDLNDADYKFIVTPGFKFETAIYEAQEKYSDAKFVLLDGAPKKDDKSDASVAKNTVSIFFAEEQSGFMAGIATALELKEGDVGFIGGMEIPPVQKFNWGYQQGVKYANENLGTNISLKEENVIYQGTFKDVAAGQQIAAKMYDKGVKAIFCSAGGTGVGAINEAKARATKGENVWIIGVDVDQYTHGIYEGEKSIILTSAVKRIDTAAYDMIKAEKEGKFPGGETLVYDINNNGVGIPDENPNLSADTISKVKEVGEKVKSGEIKVSAEKGDLIK